jgi:hypothetical protein
MPGMATEPAAATEAFEQVVISLDYCKTDEDSRQCAKMSCLLDQIRLPALLKAVVGHDSWVETTGHGEKKRDLLRRFRRFWDGAPPDGHSGAIFGALPPEGFRFCFIAGVPALTGLSGNRGHGDLAHVERQPPLS